MLDRNCFGEEGEAGTLTDTFLASPVDEEAQAVVYSGERAFSVNLIKALFEKYENESIEENIFISPSSIYHTLMLAYFGSRGGTEEELAAGREGEEGGGAEGGRECSPLREGTSPGG